MVKDDKKWEYISQEDQTAESPENKETRRDEGPKILPLFELEDALDEPAFEHKSDNSRHVSTKSSVAAREKLLI